MMIQYLKKVFTKVYYGVENYINYVISLIYIYKNKKRVQKKINNDKVLNVIFLIQYIPGFKGESMNRKFLNLFKNEKGQTL